MQVFSWISRDPFFLPNKQKILLNKIQPALGGEHLIITFNNVSVGLTFELAPSNFYLMRTASNKSELTISDATLYMDLVKLYPSILVQHQKILSTRKAAYPYKRSDVRNFTIGSGSSSFQLDNVCQGILPELVLIAMVHNDAYQGDETKNPFNFQHFGLSSFTASINGTELAPRGLEFKFNQTNPRSQHAYFNLFNQLNLRKFDRANQITPELFNNGTFILAYDLTAEHDNACSSKLESGTLRLDAKFRTKIDHAITVLVYLQFDAVLLIDENRVVYPQLF